jgi:hypothetical protein
VFYLNELTESFNFLSDQSTGKSHMQVESKDEHAKILYLVSWVSARYWGIFLFPLHLNPIRCPQPVQLAFAPSGYSTIIEHFLYSTLNIHFYIQKKPSQYL